MTAANATTEMPIQANRREFYSEAAGRQIVALRLTRANRKSDAKLAWQFTLILPGDREETTFHVFGYIAPEPIDTLKPIIASLLEAEASGLRLQTSGEP